MARIIPPVIDLLDANLAIYHYDSKRTDGLEHAACAPVIFLLC